MPITLPITTVMTVASSPTTSEMRAPQIVSDRTDRPWKSVPSQNSFEGGDSTGLSG